VAGFLQRRGVFLLLLLTAAAFCGWFLAVSRWVGGRLSERLAWAVWGAAGQAIFTTLALGLFWNLLRTELVIALELVISGALIFAFRGDVGARAAELRGASREALAGAGRRPLAAAVVLAAAVPWAGALKYSFDFPEGGFDAANYHVPMALFTLQERGIEFFETRCAHTNEFPKNAQLLYARVQMFARGEASLHFVQWGFGLAAVLALFGWMRNRGAGRGAAAACSTMFLAVPACLLQAMTNWATIDMIFAAAMLAAWGALDGCRGREGLARLGVACAIAAVAIGMRGQGLYLGGMVIAIALYWIVRHRAEPLARAAAAVAVVSLFTFSAYPFVRNLWLLGNPVSPIEVRIGDRVVFPGAFPNLDALVLTKGFTGEKKTRRALLKSWSRISMESWRYSPHPAMGQWGAAWLGVLLPGWIAALGWMVWRRRWADAILPLLALGALLLAPGNWWARFGLPYIGLALVVCAHASSAMAPRWRAGFLALLCGASLYSGWELYWKVSRGELAYKYETFGRPHRMLDAFPQVHRDPERQAVYEWVAANLPSDATLVYFQRGYFGFMELFLFDATWRSRLHGLAGARDAEEMRRLLTERGATHALLDRREAPWAPGRELFRSGEYGVFSVTDE
jgi:hypothetical protein